VAAALGDGPPGLHALCNAFAAWAGLPPAHREGASAVPAAAACCVRSFFEAGGTSLAGAVLCGRLGIGAAPGARAPRRPRGLCILLPPACLLQDAALRAHTISSCRAANAAGPSDADAAGCLGRAASWRCRGRRISRGRALNARRWRHRARAAAGGSPGVGATCTGRRLAAHSRHGPACAAAAAGSMGCRPCSWPRWAPQAAP